MVFFTKTHACVRYHNDKQSSYTYTLRLVQWLATLRCPLSCAHCLTGDVHIPDMPLTVVLRLIDEIASLNVEEFLITGGEPLVREDLPEIIARLADRKIRYSLNTAIYPTPTQQQAFTRWPPAFVAVSIDGPEACHDSFRANRGALTAALRTIEFFSHLCPVAAGTTVSTVNYKELDRTLGLVAQSGASSWGLHLLVAEGRAATRPELFLSHSQLKHLLAFIARRRSYFPVSLADEVGYCGDHEPLVRDDPLWCGAGRAQCVILPDGEVVPCTTLDHSESAGNIHRQSLRDIWEHGFSKLRQYTPEGKCRHCEYARACGGGCWLMRRHNTACFRDVWHMPGVLRTAAGVAACLGVLGLPDTNVVHAKNHAKAKTALPIDCIALVQQHPSIAAPGSPVIEPSIERRILCWYDEATTQRFLHGIYNADANTTVFSNQGEAFLAAMSTGKLANDIPTRVAAVEQALTTSEPSLALAALLWRALAEPCLDGGPVAARPINERQALRKALGALARTAFAWRAASFAKRLKPYLQRGDKYVAPSFLKKKGMTRPILWRELYYDTQQERWGNDKNEALEAYLQRHPYAEELSLQIVEIVGKVELTNFLRQEVTSSYLEIFDIITTDDAPATLIINEVTTNRELHERRIILPANAEITYADVLRLAHEQYATELDTASMHLAAGSGYSFGFMAIDPLLLQSMRTLASTTTDDQHFRLIHSKRWLADFWMF
ncbi:MAG: SPASM domain-containing protein [Deltaproteobacteria bacterium]|nr:SPASM domain-containing protein [Deltaproteobacteria bacterium]